MILLFDHNLSARLVEKLGDAFPDALHVALVGLERASDDLVWNYARAHNCIIVTKDSDFNDLGMLRGFPPKVIWLQVGNGTTVEIENILRSNMTAITAFARDPEATILSLV